MHKDEEEIVHMALKMGISKERSAQNESYLRNATVGKGFAAKGTASREKNGSQRPNKQASHDA